MNTQCNRNSIIILPLMPRYLIITVIIAMKFAFSVVATTRCNRTVTHIAQIEFYWSSLSCQFHYFVLHNLVFVSFWIRCVCNMISAHKVKHVNIYLILFHRVHTQNLQATRISKTQFSKKRKNGTFFSNRLADNDADSAAQSKWIWREKNHEAIKWSVAGCISCLNEINSVRVHASTANRSPQTRTNIKEN